MNTLMPGPSLDSLKLLCNADLGIQVYEAGELVACLDSWNASAIRRKAFRQAYLQWHGYGEALRAYYNACIVLWVQRGFPNDRKIRPADLRAAQKKPPWVGDERVHGFHRATLLRRNPAFYERYAWKDRLDIAEIYPDMHQYGAALRDNKTPVYQPPVDFDWNGFFKGLAVDISL